MGTYRLQLKGQAYLDERVLDKFSEHWTCIDLRSRSWDDGACKVLTMREWQMIQGIVMLHVLDKDVETIVDDMKRRGMELLTRMSDSMLEFTKSRQTSDLDVITVDFNDMPPTWTDIRKEWMKPTVLIGTLGFDRYNHGVSTLASRSLNMKHAFCLADVESKRWVYREPSYSFGLFTEFQPQPAWKQVCYVSPQVFYADCRPIQSSGPRDWCWLYCRIVPSEPVDLREQELPLSMQLRHDQFKDYMDIHPSLQEQTYDVIGVSRLLKNNHVVELLKYIRRANYKPGKPEWKVMEKMSNVETWQYVWTYQLATVNDEVVYVKPLGKLLLHMIQYQNIY